MMPLFASGRTGRESQGLRNNLAIVGEGSEELELRSDMQKTKARCGDPEPRGVQGKPCTM